MTMKVRHTFIRLHNATMRVLGFLLPPWNIGWKAKLLIFGGSGTVIVLVTILVTVWLVPEPEPEPSGDTIEQVGKASEVCSLGLGAPDRSDCSVEAWKACHIAQQYFDESIDDPKIEHVDSAMYICDLAVLADAGELASVLADRYGEDFEREGRYKLGNEILIRRIPGDDRLDGERFYEGYIVPNESFVFFHDLADFEFLVLNDFSDDKHYETKAYQSQAGENADSIDFPKFIDSRERYPFYYTFSAATIEILSNFTSSVENYFEYKIFIIGPHRKIVPVVGEDPWQKVSTSEVPDSVKQICDDTRKSIRERAFDTQESLDNCLGATKTCADVSPGSSTACSLVAGAVEFESDWQQLPEICSKANRPDETGVDECRSTAMEMCQYQLVSSQDYWIGQLISMNDFACATAGHIRALVISKTP